MPVALAPTILEEAMIWLCDGFLPLALILGVWPLSLMQPSFSSSFLPLFVVSARRHFYG
jgi:hypothetical protein